VQIGINISQPDAIHLCIYFLANSSICVEAVLTSGVAALFAPEIWLSE
jgi:hypothetical protein